MADTDRTTEEVDRDVSEAQEAATNEAKAAGDQAREQDENTERELEQRKAAKAVANATLAETTAGSRAAATNPELAQGLQAGVAKVAVDIVTREPPSTPEETEAYEQELLETTTQGASPETRQQVETLQKTMKEYKKSQAGKIQEELQNNPDAADATIDQFLEDEVPKEKTEEGKEEREKKKEGLKKWLKRLALLGLLGSLIGIALVLLASAESGCYEVTTDMDSGQVTYTKPVAAIYNLKDPAKESDKSKQCICATAEGKGGVPCNPKEIGGDTGGKPQITYVYQEYTAGDMLRDAVGGIGDLLGNVFNALDGLVGALPGLFNILIYIAIGVVGFFLIKFLVQALSSRKQKEPPQQVAYGAYPGPYPGTGGPYAPLPAAAPAAPPATATAAPAPATSAPASSPSAGAPTPAATSTSTSAASGATPAGSLPTAVTGGWRRGR